MSEFLLHIHFSIYTFSYLSFIYKQKQNHLADVPLLFGIVKFGAPLSRGTRIFKMTNIALRRKGYILDCKKETSLFKKHLFDWNEARDNTPLFAC